MTEFSAPKIAKWPFYVGDVLLLGLVAWIVFQSARPIALSESILLVVGVVLGALIGVLPHLLEYRATWRIAEAYRLENALTQLRRIEAIGVQISSATANWQAVQDEATKAVAASQQISQEITSEAKAFQEFLSQANDTERNHLRLEVEKLRRGEGETLEVLVRVFDHVYALYLAAVRSQNPSLIDQLTGFQRACRDAAQKIGLVPFAPEPGSTFDPETSQLMDPEATLPVDLPIAETLGTGFRFQGRLLRKAVVLMQDAPRADSDLSISSIAQRHEETSPPTPEPELEPESTEPETEPALPDVDGPSEPEATPPEMPVTGTESEPAPGPAAEPFDEDFPWSERSDSDPTTEAAEEVVFEEEVDFGQDSIVKEETLSPEAQIIEPLRPEADEEPEPSEEPLRLEDEMAESELAEQGELLPTESTDPKEEPQEEDEAPDPKDKGTPPPSPRDPGFFDAEDPDDEDRWR